MNTNLEKAVNVEPTREFRGLHPSRHLLPEVFKLNLTFTSLLLLLLHLPLPQSSQLLFHLLFNNLHTPQVQLEPIILFLNLFHSATLLQSNLVEHRGPVLDDLLVRGNALSDLGDLAGEEGGSGVVECVLGGGVWNVGRQFCLVVGHCDDFSEV